MINHALQKVTRDLAVLVNQITMFAEHADREESEEQRLYLLTHIIRVSKDAKVRLRALQEVVY